ncbi:TonB-dependent siderophore receptor [Methylosinus sp. LW4]|uniref:TonB-dependent siderophore receptor n=1 Tax=Methylosinus sp. LW4 TaxID=136993 RepID=UPI0012F85FD5|nr:TonB-dependent siderophore receptor [Methylosinus sp. LW4]
MQGYVASRSTAGTKTNASILEVPQSISVVTRRQMEVRNVQREGEAFRYTAGVFAEPYGADSRPLFDAPIIRGFDATTNGLYRDGLREANGVWGRFLTEFYGLERVDVLKGPSSVLYGQGGPGGVIDKVTKKPTDNARGEVYMQGGTFDRKQGAVDFSGPLDADKRFLYRIVGMVRDSETQFRYDGDKSVPDIRQYVAPSLTWRPTDDTSLTILGDWLHNRSAGPFTLTFANQSYTRIMTGDPSFNKSDVTQGTVGYRFEHKLGDAITFRQNMRYGAHDLQYNNMTASSITATGIVNRSATMIDEQIYSFALDNAAETKFATGPLEHTALAGIDYQSATYTTRTRAGGGPTLSLVYPVYGQLVTQPTTVTSYSHQTATQLGFYGQDQIKFDNFVLTIGARYDDARSTTTNYRTSAVAIKTDNEPSYRVGLNYLFAFGLAPYVGYSRAFLPTAGTDFGGNPFKPTFAEQIEGGLKYQPQDFPGMFAIAYFDLTQQNVLTPDPARPATTYKVQTGEVNSNGLEVQATLNPIPGLDIVAAYTHNPVRVTKDNANSQGVSFIGRRPAYIAKDYGSLWADYTIQDGSARGFGIGAGVRAIGPTYADSANTVQNKGYTLVDLTLHYEPKHIPELERFRLQLNVNNLLDRLHIVCTATTNCQWGAERSIVGTLFYRW